MIHTHRAHIIHAHGCLEVALPNDARGNGWGKKTRDRRRWRGIVMDGGGGGGRGNKREREFTHAYVYTHMNGKGRK